MSRSRRKTPITGNCGTSSDKQYKVSEHRRERRRVKSTGVADADPKSPKKFGSTWLSRKDGKFHFDPVEHPKLMRK